MIDSKLILNFFNHHIYSPVSARSPQRCERRHSQMMGVRSAAAPGVTQRISAQPIEIARSAEGEKKLEAMMRASKSHHQSI